MKITVAMAEHLEKINAEEERQVQARQAKDAEDEANRQRFIATLRELIELQYDLELTDEDVAEWVVSKMSGDCYEMKWESESGSVMLAFNATITSIEPGPDAADLCWSAYYAPTRWTASFKEIIPALVYARTGKHL